MEWLKVEFEENDLKEIVKKQLIGNEGYNGMRQRTNLKKDEKAVSRSDSLKRHKEASKQTQTTSSGGQSKRLWKVTTMFFEKRAAKRSLSGPNCFLEWRMMESIMYKPGTLYSGRHCHGGGGLKWRC